MRKRGFVFGDFDTAAHGFTLTEWKLSAPKRKTYFVDRPCGDGRWDLTSALSDVPVFENRTLSAVFEISAGSRLKREAVISKMINSLTGETVDVTFPDDKLHYMTGIVSVEKNYNDLAHGAVNVSAELHPWQYDIELTKVTISLSGTEQTLRLANSGKKAVIPTAELEGSHFDLTWDGEVFSKDSAGIYTIHGLLLRNGVTIVSVSGSGSLTISYRQAVL